MMIDMTPLYKFAQAYGRDSAYGRNEYTCGNNQACLAQYENGDTIHSLSLQLKSCDEVTQRARLWDCLTTLDFQG